MSTSWRGVRELVRAASPAVCAALAIEYDHAGEPTRFADDKLLVVAHLPLEEPS